MENSTRRESVSPLTGVAYPLPATGADSEAIHRFLAVNAGRKVVVVQGLGFVGAVMALVCANTGSEDYAVLGVDLASPEAWWRIRSLNDGTFPLTAGDPKIEKFFAAARRNNRFLATHDPDAYSVADVIVVDINLDVKKSHDCAGLLDGYDVDLGGFRRAMTTIGDHCREGVLVVVETTVPPGTCQNVVHPILVERLRGRGLDPATLRLGHSYERVMPGPDYIDSIRTFPRVYSGIDEPSAAATETFLRTIIDTEKCPLTRLSSTNATEMAKVLENSYRAMNIAFVVEWSRFAEEAGVDIYSVVNAIRQRPTHANLMYPGIGVGGYCLTKDPLLASWARRSFFAAGTALDCSVGAVRINDQMPTFAFEFLQTCAGDVHGKKVLLMGVAYRGDVGDTRFSPVDPFYDHLVGAGADVLLHDPFVPHWPEKNAAVSQDLHEPLAAGPDIIVISAMHREYRSEATISQLADCRPCLIYDTLGLLSESQVTRLRGSHIVKVLGRGDL
jgi:UDP-N-acetyl-D-glucosamine dehydrogenase